MLPQRKYKFVISGGGTGGHIFPALAIADALQTAYPYCAIHFVGALGRMEMEKVPQHGYTITGLPITGFNRQSPLKNVTIPFKLAQSIAICRFLLRDRKPDVVIGTGGFASGPLLWQAQRYKIPTVIQEQNSYAGVTNKILAKKAKAICVAYKGLEKWFPADKITLTGNPVRQNILAPLPDKATATQYFGFDANLPIVLILGGSLGARAINQAVANQLDKLCENGTQILWQCGKLYEAQYTSLANKKVKIQAFIADMPSAYAAADVVISRAGASTISELCIVGKAAVLVPSPNVAEDHQTHNAKALSSEKGAILLPESALATLAETVNDLVIHPEKRDALTKNILKFGLPNATQSILNQIKAVLP